MTKGKSQNFYKKVAARKREKPGRKCIAEEAISVMQHKGFGVSDFKVKDVVDKAEEIQKASGVGKEVGRSTIQKAVKSAIDDLKDQTPAKQGFSSDDDAIVLSSRVKKNKK